MAKKRARESTATIVNDYMKRRAAFWDCLILFVGSVVFFLYNIQYPSSKNFDEFHYIPSALQWISLSENQNWEHPPFAKLLISVGIRWFGDNPLGWRFMSVIFGGLTLVGMYRLAYELFGRDRRAAWICAMITLFNQLLYVQARIAMLDTFMMAFLAWSLFYFVRAFDPLASESRYTFRAGLFMGLAIACKWFALVPWAMCGGLLLFQAVRLRSRDRFIDLVLYWALVPLAAYYATFYPYLLIKREQPFTVWELLTSFQARMLDGQKRVVSSHPYMSQFYDWFLMRRPIWYAFDREGTDTVRGVVLLGNPVVMWGGLVAMAALIYEFLKRRSMTAFLILYFYLGFAFCWVAIPRKVAFYYYYYPAGMMLGLAITYWIMKAKHDWIVYIAMGTVFGCFFYFFPILAALPIPANAFMRWMWFPSWI